MVVSEDDFADVLKASQKVLSKQRPQALNDACTVILGNDAKAIKGQCTDSLQAIKAMALIGYFFLLQLKQRVDLENASTVE